jgi:hypothetical protein
MPLRSAGVILHTFLTSVSLRPPCDAFSVVISSYQRRSSGTLPLAVTWEDRPMPLQSADVILHPFPASVSSVLTSVSPVRCSFPHFSF